MLRLAGHVALADLQVRRVEVLPRNASGRVIVYQTRLAQRNVHRGQLIPDRSDSERRMRRTARIAYHRQPKIWIALAKVAAIDENFVADDIDR